MNRKPKKHVAANLAKKKTVKKSSSSRVKNTTVESTLQQKQVLSWQGALHLISKRVVKISSPRGHGTGFHIGSYGTDGNLCAVATAYHVVSAAYEWGEPIKITQMDSFKVGQYFFTY